MKTIILAAGVGQRLGEISGNRPKCLLEFDGRSLLRRHLDILQYYGISDITLVTGYQESLIKNHIKPDIAKGLIKTVHNPDYTSGSLISMQVGLQAPGNSDDFILMDADVLYDHRIIERLLSTDHSNCFLLDREFEAGDEPVKLCVRDGLLVEFRKKINDNLRFDFQGESVGFFRFSGNTAKLLSESAAGFLARSENQQPYEECIRELLLANPGNFGFEDITGLDWIEIDFPEDVSKASDYILPRLSTLD